MKSHTCRDNVSHGSGNDKESRANAKSVIGACDRRGGDGAQVVCLGASNTRGMGVANEAAYPVQLEAMLRAKGYRGRVLNSGISGDTTAGMLARLDSAVPPDTRVVILQPGGNDLRRRGAGAAEREANIEKILSRLGSRGLQVVMLQNDMLQAVPNQYRQADGEHLTPEGYRLLASWLAPKVAPMPDFNSAWEKVE